MTAHSQSHQAASAPHTVAIIQARIGSTRLPRKVLADIAGRSMLERVVERVAAACSVNAVVVATTTAAEDDAIEQAVAGIAGCGLFRGAVDDVLSRYHDCAVEQRADVVVRVTADDPLKDPQIIERAVQLLRADPALDYCSNTITPTFPEGLDIEVFRFPALARAHAAAALASEREHVTPYIWKHPELFRVLNFTHARDLSAMRWTVDKPEDLEFMRQVFTRFDNGLVNYQDVLSWLEKNPHISQINAGTMRNEGYQHSLQSEKQ